MNPQELARRLTVKISRRLFGPSITDRDYPNTRPVNPARDRIQIAKIEAGIVDKQTALSAITTQTSLALADYNHRTEFHLTVREHAIGIARQSGATTEEITRSIDDGKLQGFTMRQGFDDYWL